MTQGPIENPVINSPYVEPRQHFVTGADGTVTGEIEPRRRPSEFFVPVAQPKKRSGQLTLDAFGGPKRQQPNEIVNEIRQAVERWRVQDYPHITSTTRDLLAHWRDEDRLPQSLLHSRLLDRWTCPDSRTPTSSQHNDLPLQERRSP